ncbi:MAG: M28 family peptidase [Gemmatimonadota bacterium]
MSTPSGLIGVAWILASLLPLHACTGGAETSASRETTPATQLLSEPSDSFVAADSAQLMSELRFLSSDSLEGRRTGETGNVLAREFIRAAFGDAGLHEPPGGFVQPFEFRGRGGAAQVTHAANVVGFLPGRDPSLGAIVITAHFDHLGVRAPRPGTPEAAVGDSIFNGADDNASGTVALLSIARYMAQNQPRHTLVFAALDGEEVGLRGARAFMEAGWPPEIALNINLDMVSRSDSLLFAAGPFHYPQLRPILEAVPARPPVVLRFGHDQPGVNGVDDWTGSSDHRVFHDEGIPFVYFGVEDHEDYHRATDEFARVDPTFFVNAIRTILAGVLALDEQVGPASSGTPGAGERPGEPVAEEGGIEGG